MGNHKKYFPGREARLPGWLCGRSSQGQKTVTPHGASSLMGLSFGLDIDGRTEL